MKNSCTLITPYGNYEIEDFKAGEKELPIPNTLIYTLVSDGNGGFEIFIGRYENHKWYSIDGYLQVTDVTDKVIKWSPLCNCKLKSFDELNSATWIDIEKEVSMKT